MRQPRSTTIPYVKINISGQIYTFVHSEDVEVFPITGHNLRYNLLRRPVIGYIGGFFYDYSGSGFSIVNPSNGLDSIFKESDGTWPPSRSQLYNTEIGFFPELNGTPIFLGQSRILSWDENKGIPKITFKVQPLNPIGYKLFNGSLRTDYLGQTLGNVFTIGDFKNAPAIAELSTSETILYNETGADPNSAIVVYNNSVPVAVTNPQVAEVTLESNTTAFIDMSQSSDDPIEDDQDSWMTRDYISPSTTNAQGVVTLNPRPDEPARVGPLRQYLIDNNVGFDTSGSTTINSTFTVGRHILTRKFLARNLYITDNATSNKFANVVVNQLVGLSSTGGITGGDIYRSERSIDLDDTVNTLVHRRRFGNNDRSLTPEESDINNTFEIRTNVTDSQNNIDFQVNQLYSTIGSQYTNALSSPVNIFDNDVTYYRYKESNFTLEFDKSAITVDRVFNPDGVNIVANETNADWQDDLFQVDEITSGTNPSWTRNRGTARINYTNGTDSVASIKAIIIFGSQVRMLLDTASDVYAGRTVSDVVVTTATTSLIGNSPTITGAHNIDFTASTSRFVSYYNFSDPSQHVISNGTTQDWYFSLTGGIQNPIVTTPFSTTIIDGSAGNFRRGAFVESSGGFDLYAIERNESYTISTRYYYQVEMSSPVFFNKTFYEYTTQRDSLDFYYRTDANSGQVGGSNFLEANDHTGNLGDAAESFITNQVNNESSFSSLNYYPRQISIGTGALSSRNINNLITSIDGGNKLRVQLLTENNIGTVTIDGVSRIIPIGSVDNILTYIAGRLEAVNYEPFPGDPVTSVVVSYDANANLIKNFIIGSTSFASVLTFKEILSQIGEWSGLQFGYTYTRTSTGLQLTINCNFSIGSSYVPVRTYKLDEFAEKPNPTQNMIPEIILASTRVNVRTGSQTEEREIVVQFGHSDFVLPTSLDSPIGGETITVEHINNNYVSVNSSDEMRQLLQGKFEQMARPTDTVTIPEIDLGLKHGDIIECDSEILGVTETYRIVGITAIDTEQKQMNFTVEVIESRPLKQRR